MDTLTATNGRHNGAAFGGGGPPGPTRRRREREKAEAAWKAAEVLGL
jgi:hypothetical protein